MMNKNSLGNIFGILSIIMVFIQFLFIESMPLWYQQYSIYFVMVFIIMALLAILNSMRDSLTDNFKWILYGLGGIILLIDLIFIDVMPDWYKDNSLYWSIPLLTLIIAIETIGYFKKKNR